MYYMQVWVHIKNRTRRMEKQTLLISKIQYETGDLYTFIICKGEVSVGFA